MRGTISVLILGFLLVFGCVEEQAGSGIEIPEVPDFQENEEEIEMENESEDPEIAVDEKSEFTDNGFSIEYPESWQDVETDEESSILNKGYGYCALAVNKFEYFTPNLLKPIVEDYLDGVKWDGNTYEGEFSEGETEFHSKNRMIYCDCATYLLSIGCAKDNFDYETADRILDSAECSCAFPDAGGKGKVGLVVTPPDGDTFMETYCMNMREARVAGATYTHMYFPWAQIEKTEGDYNWTVPDYVVEVNELNDMKMSAVVSVIYTNQIGELPEDVEFTHLKEEKFKERFSDFMIDFIGRYKDTIKYFEIGNEVNIYFQEHPDEVDDFKEFYEYVYDEIKKEHPDVEVGTIFAYHAAKETDTEHIIEELADIGDFNAFTLYVHGENYAFNRDVDDADGFFDEIEDISDKPYIITETGWSTSSMLKSDEEKQAEYVGKTFEIFKEKDDRMEMFAYFCSNDISEKECGNAAESFISESMGDDIKETTYWAYFEEFICTLGLKDVDNNAKQGWNEWIKETKEYTGVG